MDFHKIGFSNTDKGGDHRIFSGMVRNFQICTKNINYAYGSSTPLDECKLKAARHRDIIKHELIVSVIGSQWVRIYNECLCKV